MATAKPDYALSATNGALPVLKTGQDLHSLVHNHFTPDKFNVLVPRAMSFSPGIKVAIQMVELDSRIDEKKKRSKDFWSIDGEEYILSSNAIRKIAAAANIQWAPEQCKVESEQYDEHGQVLRLRYKAVCTIVTSLGTVKNGVGTYEYNYHQDLKDSRFQEKEWNEKARKKVATGNLKIDQINQRRQFAVQLVESGAKARAIYDAFGIMEKSYSKADIAKPFLVPCALHDIDYGDPAIKKMIAEQAIGAAKDAFGAGPVKADYEVLKGDKEQPQIDKGTGEVIEQEESQGKFEPPSGLPMPGEKPTEPTTAQKRAVYRDEWASQTPVERAKKINMLIDKLKARQWFEAEAKKQNWTPIESWADETQINWIMLFSTKAGEIPAEEAGNG